MAIRWLTRYLWSQGEKKKIQMTVAVWDLAFFFLSLLPSFPQLFATESQQNRPSEHFVLALAQTP